MSIYYEGTQIFTGPAKPPAPVWCPRCHKTIIDPLYKLCPDCEDALQSEDK